MDTYSVAGGDDNETAIRAMADRLIGDLIRTGFSDEEGLAALSLALGVLVGTEAECRDDIPFKLEAAFRAIAKIADESFALAEAERKQ